MPLTAIAYQTTPHEPAIHITAKDEIRAFEATYLHPLALCALFDDLGEMASKIRQRPPSPLETEHRGAVDLDAATFQPLPSEDLSATPSAPPAMEDAFATHPSPPNIDDYIHDLRFLDDTLKDIAAGFDFLSITLAHDPNAYLEMLGMQGQGAPHVDAAESPFSHIAYEIRIYRGIIAVLRVFDTGYSDCAHRAEYILVLGKSPLLEIRQLTSVVSSPRIFFSAFRLFFTEGALTVQYQNPDHRQAVIRAWIDGDDLRIQCRLGFITREIRITGALLSEMMTQISAVLQADPVKMCAVMPDLMTLGAWLFRTTDRIPRARLLLDIDPSYRIGKTGKAGGPDRPKAQFRPDTGFDTLTRMMEFQSDVFFDEIPWPQMLPLGLIKALRLTVYVPASSDPSLPAKIADIGNEWAMALNMGQNAQPLLNALKIIPSKGKWTNRIPIPKTVANNFPDIMSLYRMTIPIANVRLRFDYASSLAKIWASLHTTHGYSELGYDRVQATFGEPVYLSLANLGLKDLPPIIAELDTLEVIDLSYNRLTYLPAWLAAMPRLRKLNLTGNRIKSLAPLYTSPWIQEIICDGNPLADFTATTADTAATEGAEKGKAKSDLPVD